MSSYYAGYHGVACVLSVVEFEDFLKRYMEKHPEDGFTEDNVDELYFDEFEFKRSNGNGIFHVVEISTDKADGMCLWPFKAEDQEDGGFKELRGKDQYVVFADYSPDSLEFIKDPKYHSYADILNELKGKLEGYLPDDFPWDERIGRYSYAMYA